MPERRGRIGEVTVSEDRPPQTLDDAIICRRVISNFTNVSWW